MEEWDKGRSPAQAVLPHLNHLSLFSIFKSSSNGIVHAVQYFCLFVEKAGDLHADLIR